MFLLFIIWSLKFTLQQFISKWRSSRNRTSLASQLLQLFFFRVTWKSLKACSMNTAPVGTAWIIYPKTSNKDLLSISQFQCQCLAGQRDKRLIAFTNSLMLHVTLKLGLGLSDCNCSYFPCFDATVACLLPRNCTDTKSTVGMPSSCWACSNFASNVSGLPNLGCRSLWWGA